MAHQFPADHGFAKAEELNEYEKQERDGKERAKAYEIIQKLGAGQSGEVHLCMRVMDKKVFVMKKIPVSGLSYTNTRRALTEVSVVASVRHPFIIQHQESYVHEENLCIVMEYASEGDLSQRITAQRRKGRYFSEERMLKWFTQIALALKHMHDRKILHRDLKPENILLDGNLNVKVADFGLTMVLDKTEAMAATTLGTPFFMSPELCEGKPYGYKNDIWALGIVLFLMAALRRPFVAQTLAELVRAIVHNPVPALPKSCPPRVKDIIHVLLAKDHRQRPNINQIFTRWPILHANARELLPFREFTDEFSHTHIHTGDGLQDVEDEGGDSDDDYRRVQEAIDTATKENSMKNRRQGPVVGVASNAPANEAAFNELLARLEELPLDQKKRSKESDHIDSVEDMRRRYLKNREEDAGCD